MNHQQRTHSPPRRLRAGTASAVAVRTIACLLLSSSAIPGAGAPPCTPVARLRYGGGGDWYSNQTSVVNLKHFANTHTTLVLCEGREPAVALSDDALFSHPLLFATGHGKIQFTPRESTRLSEYLRSGGFLHVDDNFGLDESFRAEIERIFPETPMVELPPSHPIFHIGFEFSDGLPKIHEHHGGPPHAYGLYLHNRLALFYSYNTDLSDGWEDAEVHGNSEAKRRAALQMGTNVLIYALTR